MNNIFSKKEFTPPLKKKNHIIFICDHASNQIPNIYQNLGLKKDLLKSHISIDLGAKEFCVSLTKILGQSYFYSNFSRLLIDPNRSSYSDQLIARKSCGIEIPGNIKINSKEKKKRIMRFHEEYHCNLKKLVEKKSRQYEKVFLIAIHSFTKIYDKENRSLEIGLLWNKNMNLLLKIQKELTSMNVHFGRNYPYSGFFYNYTLDRHSKKGTIDNISIELRNDLICDEKGFIKYTNIFKKIFKKLL